MGEGEEKKGRKENNTVFVYTNKEPGMVAALSDSGWVLLGECSS